MATTTRGAVATPKRGPSKPSPNVGLRQMPAGSDPQMPCAQPFTPGLDHLEIGSDPHLSHVRPATSRNGSPIEPAVAQPKTSTDSRSYVLLGFYGDMLDDFEALRIATAARRRTLTDQ